MAMQNSIISSIMILKSELESMDRTNILARINYKRYKKNIIKRIKEIRNIDLNRSFFMDLTTFLYKFSTSPLDFLLGDNSFSLGIYNHDTNDTIKISSINAKYNSFLVEGIITINGRQYRVTKTITDGNNLYEILNGVYDDSIDYKIYKSIINTVYNFIIDELIKYIEEE